MLHVIKREIVVRPWVKQGDFVDTRNILGRSMNSLNSDQSYVGSPRIHIQHRMSWINIISNNKPWEILLISCYNTFLSLHNFSVSLLVPNVISTALLYNPLRRHRSGLWKIDPMGDIHRIWRQTYDNIIYHKDLYNLNSIYYLQKNSVNCRGSV